MHKIRRTILSSAQQDVEDVNDTFIVPNRIRPHQLWSKFLAWTLLFYSHWTVILRRYKAGKKKNWTGNLQCESGMIQNRRMVADDTPVLEGRLNIVTGEAEFSQDSVTRFLTSGFFPETNSPRRQCFAKNCEDIRRPGCKAGVNRLFFIFCLDTIRQQLHFFSLVCKLKCRQSQWARVFKL